MSQDEDVKALYPNGVEAACLRLWTMIKPTVGVQVVTGFEWTSFGSPRLAWSFRQREAGGTKVCLGLRV